METPNKRRYLKDGYRFIFNGKKEYIVYNYSKYILFDVQDKKFISSSIHLDRLRKKHIKVIEKNVNLETLEVLYGK